MRAQWHFRWLAIVAVSILAILGMPGIAFAQSDNLSVSPASGPPGQSVTLYGTGFEAYSGSQVEIDISIDYGNGNWDLLVAGAAYPVPDANGNFAVNVTIPSNAPPGDLLAISSISEPMGLALFTVTRSSGRCPPKPQPTIYWSQIAGPQGAHFSVTGNGWFPKETVAIHLPSGKVFRVGSASWRADSSGGWKQKITVDKAARLGKYKLVFTQSACGGLRVPGSFKVTLTTTQYSHSVAAIYQLVSAANSVCHILSCSKAWNSSLASKAIGIIDTVLTVFYEAKAVPETVTVGNDLKALEKALKKAHNHKKDPAVKKAVKKLKADTIVLEDTLIAICPPLELLFPPAVS